MYIAYVNGPTYANSDNFWIVEDWSDAPVSVSVSENK